jgi:hypothetical protein
MMQIKKISMINTLLLKSYSGRTLNIDRRYFAATLYNLKMEAGRQNPPYAAIDNYSTDLKTSGKDTTKYPIQVDRHHVLPCNTLIEFWNKVVENRQLKGLQAFLQAISTNIGKYKFDPKTLSSVDKDHVKAFIDGINKGTIDHGDGAKRVDGWDSFAACYQWLPGNLFVGPTADFRTDDPTDGFEVNAKTMMSSDQYAFPALQNAYNDILAYKKEGYQGTLKDVQKISGELARVATSASEPRKLDYKQWNIDAKAKRYSIRN